MPIDAALYTLPYIQRREKWRNAYILMADVFSEVFGTGSIIDVGCAGGILVEVLQAAGFDAWGLDGAPASESLWPAERRHRYLLADLTDSAAIDIPATDLVCSFEVAEHLPEESAARYVALLARHRPRRILFTAAPLGQRGTGHVNCQLFSYWIGLFAALDYRVDLAESCAVRQRLRTAFDENGFMIVPKHYSNNFLSFRPRELRASAVAEIELGAELEAELAAQRELLNFLVQRSANVIEMIEMLRRHRGELTELSEEEAWQMRSFAY
jgi:hypothetical protein